GAALSPGLVAQESAVLPWMLGLILILAAAAVLLITGRGWRLGLALARRARMPVDRISARFPRGSHFGLPARSWAALGLPLLLSALFQVVVVLINLLVCLALGIPLTFIQLLWIVAVVSLLQALPISIAGIGVREGAYIYLLQLQGVDGSRALALSLTLFALQIAMAIVGGTLQVRGLLRAQS
ncbi:MAG TPA: lysylphosphatidylglycerol synthase domain-containing protein, partial [Chloroflexia bacterium]|nr:lysylphosphatidylglycerol synthase domain-containing protein [Chloroflexia bacterium]